MEVRIKRQHVGPGVDWQPGDVVTVSNAIGRRMIESGAADLYTAFGDQLKPPETATADPPEAAVEPRPARRKAAKSKPK